MESPTELVEEFINGQSPSTDRVQLRVHCCARRPGNSCLPHACTPRSRQRICLSIPVRMSSRSGALFTHDCMGRACIQQTPQVGHFEPSGRSTVQRRLDPERAALGHAARGCGSRPRLRLAYSWLEPLNVAQDDAALLKLAPAYVCRLPRAFGWLCGARAAACACKGTRRCCSSCSKNARASRLRVRLRTWWMGARNPHGWWGSRWLSNTLANCARVSSAASSTCPRVGPIHNQRSDPSARHTSLPAEHRHCARTTGTTWRSSARRRRCGTMRGTTLASCCRSCATSKAPSRRLDHP